MDYRITCVCGHQFQLSDAQVKGSVACPACHQRLRPEIVAPARRPASDAAVNTEADAAGSSNEPMPASPAEEMKRCPFCGEAILAIARKCKHCNEFLDRAPPPLSASQAGPNGAAPAADGGAGVNGTAGDEPVFSLAVSQWDNFWKFLILLTFWAGIVFVLWFFAFFEPYRAIAALGGLVFVGFIGWYHYLAASHTRVFVRPLRVDTEKGILSKKLDSLELFRITDVELKQNFVERLLGIGTLYLMTTDSSSEPELILYQVPRAKEVYKYLQTQIPLAARQRGAIYMEK